MMRQFFALLILLMLGTSATAAQLVMVEEDGCVWCQKWDRELSAIYPKTPEGQAAPLRRIDIRNQPAELDFARRVHFTPTFVLVDNGTELARIEGYPGEDFFWGLLDQMLRQHTDYEGNSR